MNFARLKQIEEIYHEATKLPPSAHTSYLSEACGGDEDLRREVVSLLAFHDSAEDLISATPQSFAAQMFSSEDREAELIGTDIGPYHIHSLIGSGGMGQVFLANDSRLERKVALKILRHDVVADADRRRFEREAYSVSKLNHPNILTVYEFGFDSNFYYLAAEYIEGNTLRQRVASGTLSPADSLEIIEQVGSALAAAHQAGIVHRDIKPENIMIRNDGIVKLLDFGIAKTVRKPGEDAVTMAKTRPGLIMGTVSYMSPEQTRGQATDERTDIWSLGAVFYEMLTGTLPFRGETSSDVIASILRSDPVSPRSLISKLPRSFDLFIERTLRKEKAERYASIADVLAELAVLKNDLEIMGDSVSGFQTGKGWWNRTSRNAATETQFNLDTHSTTKPSTHQSNVRRRSKSYLIAAVLFAVLIPVGAWSVWRYVARSSQPAATVLSTRVQKRLTTYGDVSRAVISPDGRSVAYISKQGKTNALLIQPIDTSDFKTILPPEAVNIQHISFSPDSRFIYFIREYERTPLYSILYRISVDGGEPEQVVFDVDYGVSFSPDASQFVFRRENVEQKTSSLFIANADGTNERMLAQRLRPDGFMNWPVWSPDGRKIASIVNEPVPDPLEYAVVTVDTATGEQTRLGTSRWRWTDGVAWEPGGDALILNAQENPARPDQLWRLSYPQGETSRVTDDFNKYGGITVSSDGSQIVSVQNRQDLGLFVGSADTPDTASRILAIQGLSYYGIAFAPNGNIIYACNADGNRQIWSVRSDGTERKMLTKDTSVKDRPAASPDGRYIVFRSEQETRGSIMRMNVDGSELLQLTNGGSDTDPAVSADSQWVYYTASLQGTTQPVLWKVSINGGVPIQITNRQTRNAEPSPDGKYVAAFYFRESSDDNNALSLLDAQTGEVKRITTVRDAKFQWRPNAPLPSVVFPRDEVSNIESFSFEKNISTKVSSFITGQITDFAYSADGKQIAMIRGSVTNSIVILTAEKP